MSSPPTSDSTPLEDQLTQELILEESFGESEEAPLGLNVGEDNSQLETDEEILTQDAVPAAVASSTDEASDFGDEFLGHSILCIQSRRVLRPWDDDARYTVSDPTLDRIAAKLEIPSGGRGWRNYIDPKLYNCYLGKKNYVRLELLIEGDDCTTDSSEAESTLSVTSPSNDLNEDEDSNSTIEMDYETQPGEGAIPSIPALNDIPGPSGQPRTSITRSVSMKPTADKVFMKFSKKFDNIILVDFYKPKPPTKPENENLFPLKFFSGGEVKSPIAYDIMGFFRDGDMHFLALVPIFFERKSRKQQPIFFDLKNKYGAKHEETCMKRKFMFPKESGTSDSEFSAQWASDDEYE